MINLNFIPLGPLALYVGKAPCPTWSMSRKQSLTRIAWRLYRRRPGQSREALRVLMAATATHKPQ